MSRYRPDRPRLRLFFPKPKEEGADGAEELGASCLQALLDMLSCPAQDAGEDSWVSEHPGRIVEQKQANVESPRAFNSGRCGRAECSTTLLP